MRRNIFYLILGFVISVSLLYGITLIPHKLIYLEVEDVAKITIIHGTTGDKITIHNSEDIKHLVDNLNNISIHKLEINLHKGFNYYISLYDNEGNVIEGFAFTDKRVSNKDFSFSVFKGKLDTQYIEYLYTIYPKDK